jgi:hypothetical protein
LKVYIHEELSIYPRYYKLIKNLKSLYLDSLYHSIKEVPNRPNYCKIYSK